MTRQQKEQQIINDLQRIEAQAEALRQLSYNVRVDLMCFYASAPKGGKKSALSAEQKTKLKSDLRKSLLKKAG